MELVGVSKNFGNLQAVHNVSLKIYAGEVTGLIGDNGAGKSTLAKLMNGFFRPDSGLIMYKGVHVAFGSPRDARERGIETVYQDLALIPGMNLWRNFFLGNELPKRTGPLPEMDRRSMRETTMEILRDIGLTRLRSPDEPVNVLSGGERQAIAIARARYYGGELLILDEPTSALSVKETRKVSEAILAIRDRGAAVVIIEHNLRHIYGIADRIIVLEAGRIIEDVKKRETSESKLEDLVAGRHLL